MRTYLSLYCALVIIIIIISGNSTWFDDFFLEFVAFEIELITMLCERQGRAKAHTVSIPIELLSLAMMSEPLTNLLINLNIWAIEKDLKMPFNRALIGVEMKETAFTYQENKE